MTKELSPSVLKRVLEFQQAELDSSVAYEVIAQRQTNQENRETIRAIARAERSHYEILKRYTGQELKPNRFKIAKIKLMQRILGETFTIKYFENMEDFNARDLESIAKEIPEAVTIIADEEEHEERLMKMIDEERLQYIGSMVLGLNDALVELTGTIAGLTFALANTRLVALSAIITGVSATLSMAASNYLAERADGNEKALVSSVYTGIAYLITVALMVLPYLLLPNELYLTAFIAMLVIVILIIAIFNYYISVVHDVPFLKRFGEMATISLGVAAISFGIGLLAKSLLGIDF